MSAMRSKTAKGILQETVGIVEQLNGDIWAAIEKLEGNEFQPRASGNRPEFKTIPEMVKFLDEGVERARTLLQKLAIARATFVAANRQLPSGGFAIAEDGDNTKQNAPTADVAVSRPAGGQGAPVKLVRIVARHNALQNENAPGTGAKRKGGE